MSRNGNIGGHNFLHLFDPIFRAQIPRRVPIQRGKRKREIEMEEKWVDRLLPNDDF